MSGSMWEWTADCWNNNCKGAPTDGRAWTSGECAQRVLRGGSWGNYPQNLRSAIRSGNSTSLRLNINGFRVSRTD